MFHKKNIVLGVTGGIAAYKALELLRLFQKNRANVFVIMTKNACEFVAPLSFEALSKNCVYIDTFNQKDSNSIKHIELAQLADIVVIAPATANIIAKFAHGIADDLLTTFMLATKSKKLICPAMNEGMYENSITQKNIQSLKDNGFYVLNPDKGELACQDIGRGRLPELDYIVHKTAYLLNKKDLKGKKILITAGPTQEAIDPVRFITNHSSGKTGYFIAEVAQRRGADVTLISGKTSLKKPYDIKLINVISADDMLKEVLNNIASVDVIIKVAAVADYKPVKCAKNKIKKKEEKLNLSLTKTKDILKEIDKKKGQLVIGFAAETTEIKKNAQKKLKEKKLDMIVANKVGKNLSFGTDESKVTFIYKDGTIKEMPLMEKEKVADAILDNILILPK